MLLHLATATDWRDALGRGTYGISTLGRTIAQEGFLHASADRAQADGVAHAFYGGVDEPLVLLHLDEDRLAAHGLRVVVEPADPTDPRSPRFPHVYGGELPVDVVVRVEDYPHPKA